MKNPLLIKSHELKNAQLRAAFPTHHFDSGSSTLSLHNYFSEQPERFFSQGAFSTLTRTLGDIGSTYPQELAAYFDEHRKDLDNAFRHAQEINAFDWHDETIKGSDDFRSLMIIDRDVHPAYLRLVEAVFQPMLRIAAYFSRLEAGKGTTGPSAMPPISHRLCCSRS